jgi:hypothetical protein
VAWAVGAALAVMGCQSNPSKQSDAGGDAAQSDEVRNKSGGVPVDVKVGYFNETDDKFEEAEEGLLVGKPFAVEVTFKVAVVDVEFLYADTLQFQAPAPTRNTEQTGTGLKVVYKNFPAPASDGTSAIIAIAKTDAIGGTGDRERIKAEGARANFVVKR